MRRLLYIPIVHSGPDLGSAGAAVAQESAALAGEQRWAAHQQTVRRFWDHVAAFLRSLDSKQVRVYQDGLAAGGETGRQVVEEAARRGSRNYQVVRDLLQEGAQLRKTEDPVLLLQEYENLFALVRQTEASERQRAADLYRSQRDRLLEQRDAFIARTINATLKQGESGVLFLGAYHNVAARLDADILVEMVKDRERVLAYADALFAGHDDRRLKELARYLTSPIGRETAGA